MLGFQPAGASSLGQIQLAALAIGSVMTMPDIGVGSMSVTTIGGNGGSGYVPLGRRLARVRIDGTSQAYFQDPRDPSDISLYGIEVVELPSTETVTSVVSVTATPTDMQIGTPTLYGSVAQFLVLGGTSGVEYAVKLTFRVSSGETFSRSVTLYTVTR